MPGGIVYPDADELADDALELAEADDELALELALELAEDDAELDADEDELDEASGPASAKTTTGLVPSVLAI